MICSQQHRLLRHAVLPLAAAVRMELGPPGWKESPHPPGQSRKLKHSCSCGALKRGIVTETMLRDQPEHKEWLLPRQQHRTAVVQLCCSSARITPCITALHYTLHCFGASLLSAFSTVHGLSSCCLASTSTPTVKAHCLHCSFTRRKDLKGENHLQEQAWLSFLTGPSRAPG